MRMRTTSSSGRQASATTVARSPLAAARVAVVLDNEALQAAVLTTHPKHRRLMEVLQATTLRRRALVVVPTAVRVEAGVRRTDPSATALGRLGVEDVPLTGDRADAAVLLSQGASVSVVDGTVVQCAEELAERGHRVTVYTSDVRDLERLRGRTATPISVRRV